jgi:hypothetical protein
MDCIPDVLKDANVAELGGAGSKNRVPVRISLLSAEAKYDTNGIFRKLVHRL